MVLTQIRRVHPICNCMLSSSISCLIPSPAHEPLPVPSTYCAASSHWQPENISPPVWPWKSCAFLVPGSKRSGVEQKRGEGTLNYTAMLKYFFHWEWDLLLSVQVTVYSKPSFPPFAVCTSATILVEKKWKHSLDKHINYMSFPFHLQQLPNQEKLHFNSMKRSLGINTVYEHFSM